MSHDLRPGKPPEYELDGSERYEGLQRRGEVLEILSEAAISPEPGEGALGHPAAGKDNKATHVSAALDDLQAQRRHLGDGGLDLPGMVAAIGPDQFEPREAQAYLVEDQTGTARAS